MGTHRLKSAEGGTSYNTQRKQKVDGYLQAREHKRRGKLGTVKLSEQGRVTH